MRRKRLIAGVVILAALIVAARLLGLQELLSPENLGLLRDYVSGLGSLGPVVFVFAYAAGAVAFLPDTPFTLLAGLAFGPVLGAVYALIGATAGAILSFLVARYVARDMVSTWVARNERLKKLDAEVGRQGWRILVITRLVPVFPFNLQNYAYGLTRIRLAVYAPLTALLITPGAIAYAFAGGSLTTAAEDLTRTFVFLGLAAVFFVALSLIPVFLRRKSSIRPGDNPDGDETIGED